MRGGWRTQCTGLWKKECGTLCDFKCASNVEKYSSKYAYLMVDCSNITNVDVRNGISTRRIGRLDCVNIWRMRTEGNRMRQV